MALPVLPNSSNFLAIALVINRSREGPRFIFHYPPHVAPAQGRGKKSEEEDDFEEDDDILLERSAQPTGIEPAGPRASSTAQLSRWDQDEHLTTDSGSQIVPWEHVAGFPTKDLGHILTPSRAYHKKLFQLSLDPYYCVSYPIYVPENGVWMKKSKKKRRSRSSRRDDDESALPVNMDDPSSQPPAAAASEAEHPDGQDGNSTQPATNVEEAGDKKSSMTMFNLVFFLDPKKHEVNDLVDVMFTHIIRKVNKALKYCQQKSDFVWKESKRILLLKEKGREEKTRMSVLWDEILSASSLAASMLDIYEAVSQNRIAALQLDTAEGTVTHSVQIPIPFYVSDLPQDNDTAARGLWITTANTFIDEDAFGGSAYLDKNFALLLMDDERKIIGELQSDPDETTFSMIEFVRHCKATHSLYQVAQQCSNILTPAQVRKYAQHFIFWRRAIAIPPLHARDIYILSPNCDLSRLPQAAAQWTRQFPLAPPLPNFLSDLSVAPRPYKSHCPAKPHRPLYMAMLAWLMRGGWVTQLCTFAYIVVWPEIIYEVEYAIESEEIAKEKRAQGQGTMPASVESASTTVSAGDTSVAAGGLGAPSTTPADPPHSRASSRGSSLDASIDIESSIATLRAIPHLFPASLGTHDDGTTALSNEERYTEAHQRRPSTADSGEVRSGPGQSSPSPNREPVHITSQLIPQGGSQRTQPTATEQAAEAARLQRLADRAARKLADRATVHARKPVPRPTAHPSTNYAPHLAGMAPHIVLDAKKATGKESLYLDAIQRRLRLGKSVGTAQAEKLPGGGTSAGDGGGKGLSRTERKDMERRDEQRQKTAEGRQETKGGEDGGGGARGGNRKDEHRMNNDPKNYEGREGIDSEDATRNRKGGTVNGEDATDTNSHQNDRNHSDSRDGEEWDRKVAAAWPLFWKYFNGRSALERIALQEDMKRKDVWNLLLTMSEYLLCVRHW